MDDPYYAFVVGHWGSIAMVYRQFKRQKPVILFDVQEVRIYAYPYEAFKADLSPVITSAAEGAVRAGPALLRNVVSDEHHKLPVARQRRASLSLTEYDTSHPLASKTTWPN